MQIVTRFDLGQKVWGISRSYESVKLPCLFCRGQRHLKVVALSGDYEFVACPRCKGQGSAQLVSIPAWQPDAKPMTIGRVDVQITQSAGIDGGSIYTNYQAQEGREERYMCVETGVGSGTLHSVERLYASQEEALAAAEDLNDAIREGRGAWKPDRHDVERARGFLDHRDVYEHTAEHVEQAEQIIAAYEYVAEEALA